MPFAACASCEFEVSGGRPPLSVRSPLTRQRIAALTWSMFASDGVTPVSEQFAPAATPPAFFGLWLAVAGILFCWSWNCCDLAVARPAEPTRPSVPSAVTTPPFEEDWFTGAGGLAELSLPPPPPHPATRTAVARRAVGTAVLMSLWIRFSEPSMPGVLSVIRGRFLECVRSLSSRCPVQGQPVNRGAVSFLAQRWNESRIVFGRVPEPDWKVTLTTMRWTPIFSFFGLTRSWMGAAFLE